MNYHNIEIKEILKLLDTCEKGLENKEIEERIKQYGLNELPKAKKKSIIKIFISQFENPIEIILIITVIMSLLIGEIVDALALIFIIMIDIILGTYEEYKAEKEAESLANMIEVSTKVLRNQKQYNINSKYIVPGDIIILESGDKICADARIIESQNFQTDESPLTGESLPVTKNNKIINENTILSERTNMIYAGTSVITGRAKAIVVKTNNKTEIGAIATKVINTQEEKSPLTIRVEKFSKQITFLIVIIAMLTFIVLKTKGYDFKNIFICVIALSVSAMPEGLPLALTMSLTIASKRMAKKHVIVKKLNAVESLGSCTIIASDKTGTLTVNEQTAKEIILADNSKYEITGTGYNGIGKIIPKNSTLEKVNKIIMLGAINNEAKLEYINNKWEHFGDSIDIAFLSLAKKANIKELPKVEKRIPYESENQYSAVYYKKNGKLHCTVKGSFEKIMEFSKKEELYEKQNLDLTGQGYRVIAIADGIVENTNQIENLEYIGMLAFIDPIRKEAKEALKECKKANIKVVMITGDHPLTAFNIGKTLGLCKNIDEVATSKDIEKYKKLGEEKLDEYVKTIKIFSRVTPMDKLEIVNSYKRQKEFIAVTGDGVNDAPAIKAANIGIAMGSGTDVAKETASMIITDDNFSSIVEGIKEGRIAYSNIKKIILFLIGCGIAEVSFFLLSILFNYDIPLLALQLLWLNVITDGLQDISLSLEKDDTNIMNEKPRPTKESLFSKDLMTEILILSSTITLIVFITWKLLIDNNIDIKIARTIIMMLMVFIQNINVLNCRNEKISIFKLPKFTNPIMIITIIGSIILQILISEIPLTAKLLGLTPLKPIIILEIFTTSLLIIVVYEIYKLIIKSKKH